MYRKRNGWCVDFSRSVRIKPDGLNPRVWNCKPLFETRQTILASYPALVVERLPHRVFGLRRADGTMARAIRTSRA